LPKSEYVAGIINLKRMQLNRLHSSILRDLNMDLRNILTEKFNQIYKYESNLRLFFAPGRVNLIGEHTDYNGGYVFPCALDIGTYLLVSPRTDKVCRFYSDNFVDSGIIELTLEDLAFNRQHNWVNYPKGVMLQFIEHGTSLNHGFDALFYGNLPNGAGLSSSASIEVVTGLMLNHLYHAEITPLQIALFGQAAENKYIGVNCGIMDQFASIMGKQNQAILLDCNTLKYEYTPLNIENYKLIIANSNKQRGLADSKYNERLIECQTALKLLQQKLDINSLGEINNETLENNKNLIPDLIIYNRAKHAVSENQRTLIAVDKLKSNHISEFGELMNESHLSLQRLYEVTGNELDTLVSSAWKHPGCIGARMTGAGFGGCTVNLVKKEQVDDFIDWVKKSYHKVTNLNADFYIVSPSDGAHEIFLKK